MWKILSLGQRLPICEATVTSPSITIAYQHPPTTGQQELSQTNQLSSTEEDLAQEQEIVDKFELESGSPVSVEVI